jgi:hypothetical protein
MLCFVFQLRISEKQKLLIVAELFIVPSTRYEWLIWSMGIIWSTNQSFVQRRKSIGKQGQSMKLLIKSALFISSESIHHRDGNKEARESIHNPALTSNSILERLLEIVLLRLTRKNQIRIPTLRPGNE